MKFRNLVGASFFVLLSTISVGAVSLIVLTSGARHVEADEMARFVLQWVVVNTVVVALGAAFDQLGPRLQARLPHISASLLIHATCLPLGGSFVAFGVLALLRPSQVSIGPLFFYCVAVSLWAGQRSLQISKARFGHLAIGAFAMLLTCVASMSIAISRGSVNSSALFLVAATSNLAGWLTLAIRTPIRSGLLRSSVFLPGSEYRLAGSIVMTSAASLLLSSGGMVFAESWGLSSERVVSYAGIVNIIRIPFLLLGSALAPFNVEIARLVAQGRQHSALRVAIRTILIMSSGGILVALVVCLAGRRLVVTMLGESVGFELPLALAVVLGECLLWVSSGACAFAISIGRSRMMALYWLLGVTSFAAIGVFWGLGAKRIYLAPVTGNLVVAFLFVLWVVSLMFSRSEDALAVSS